MADKEIDDLTEADPLDLADIFHIVQGGNSREGNMQKVKDLIAPDTVLSRKTADYTLVDGDLNGSTIIEMNLAGANVLTVAPSLTGTEPVTIVQFGAGQTTITAGSGVTLNSADGALKLRSQYSSCTIIRSGTDEFYVIGDVVV